MRRYMICLCGQQGMLADLGVARSAAATARVCLGDCMRLAFGPRAGGKLMDFTSAPAQLALCAWR